MLPGARDAYLQGRKVTHRKSLHSVQRLVLADEGSESSPETPQPTRSKSWTAWTRNVDVGIRLDAGVKVGIRRKGCVRSPCPAGVVADGGQCRTRIHHKT